ncbi:MAG: AAA family ATPase [Planctomycetota bacterium]
MSETNYDDLPAVADHLRDVLDKKLQKKPGKSPFVLLYAFNGTGKTRLSRVFNNLGKIKDADGQTQVRNTLYFNAFTEDLFSWDNDLENDEIRVLEMNDSSDFFNGLRELEIGVKIEELLTRYGDFKFDIEYERWSKPTRPEDEPERLRPAVVFFRERTRENVPIPIKISRGEENIFIWCFFLAVLQLALDGDPAYDWVKYVYIDDPISSLDEHNAIVVGNHLVQLYREAQRPMPTVISTHHTLFFNVLHYELKNHVGGPVQYVLKRNRDTGGFKLKEQKGDTPQFYHVAALIELWELAQGGEIKTYHFNVLRSILEKTAFFHGYGHFSRCIKEDQEDADGILHQRFVDLLSHGKYSMYEPTEMGDDTKSYFLTILRGFVERHPFNPDLLPEPTERAEAS